MSREAKEHAWNEHKDNLNSACIVHLTADFSLKKKKVSLKYGT